MVTIVYEGEVKVESKTEPLIKVRVVRRTFGDGGAYVPEDITVEIANGVDAMNTPRWITQHRSDGRDIERLALKACIGCLAQRVRA